MVLNHSSPFANVLLQTRYTFFFGRYQRCYRCTGTCHFWSVGMAKHAKKPDLINDAVCGLNIRSRLPKGMIGSVLNWRLSSRNQLSNLRMLQRFYLYHVINWFLQFLTGLRICIFGLARFYIRPTNSRNSRKQFLCNFRPGIRIIAQRIWFNSVSSCTRPL